MPAAIPSRRMTLRHTAARPPAAVAGRARAAISTTTSRSSRHISRNQTAPRGESSMSKEAIAALRNGKLSRRDLNRALAAVGLSFAVMPLTARDSRAAGSLNFFTWGGYDVPDAAPQYVAKHGGPPEFSVFASEEEALQKMLAGFEPDLMH